MKADFGFRGGGRGLRFWRPQPGTQKGLAKRLRQDRKALDSIIF